MDIHIICERPAPIRYPEDGPWLERAMEAAIDAGDDDWLEQLDEMTVAFERERERAMTR